MAERRLFIFGICTSTYLVALTMCPAVIEAQGLAQQPTIGDSGGSSISPTPAVNGTGTSPGWIVSGGNSRLSSTGPQAGAPSCSYCLNILQNTDSTGNDTGFKVGLFRCLGRSSDENELWTYNSMTSSIVSTRAGTVTQSLCLDAGSHDPSQYDVGLNASLFFFTMSPCDGSVQQRWFFDQSESRIRSGLTTTDGQPLYMVQDTNRSLVLEQATKGSPYYNVYLSRLGTNNSGNSPTVAADFTFQAAATYDRLQKPAAGPLIQNGGFEMSTLLPRWPLGVNCSSMNGDNGAACSKSRFSNGELFSLCGWEIMQPPEWVSNREQEWQPAEGNSSLLLSYGAAIRQSIPTEPNSEYLLSFSLAGYLAHSRTLDSYEVCSEGVTGSNHVSLEVGANVRKFSVDSPSNSTAGQGTPVSSLWFRQNYTFIASASTTRVVFSGDGAGAACGPVIDDVRVEFTRPLTDSSASSDSLKLVAAVLSPLVACCALVSGLTFCWWRRRRKQRPHIPCIEAHMHGRVKVYSSVEILSATNNLSSLIGEGGFSRVYRAEFSDGSVGAVKVEKSTRGGSSRYSEEVALLQRVHHRNLVNLTGFCAEDGLLCLVFEFLPNGTLFDRLHKSADSGRGPLPWASRTKICYQLACALQYLHHETSPPIVHRDVKSANILLTATDTAKLADFGLSKVAPLDSTAFHSEYTEVKGSVGYMDPKYVRSGVLSPKSDVYSYGVVLLELISGQRAIKDLDLLLYWAEEYLNVPLEAHKMVDEHLDGVYDPEDLAVLVDLVKMCVQYEAHLRPSMQQVVLFLQERRFSGVPAADMHQAPCVPTNLVLHSGHESPVSLILSVTGDQLSSSLSQEPHSSETY